jgi:hypothetical protein
MKKTLSDAENILIRGLPKAIEILEKKLKTKRGLTLQEKLVLDDLRFLMACGFSDPEGDCFETGGKVNKETLLTQIKNDLKGRSKDELLHDLAEAMLRIEDLERASKYEEGRFKFLLDYFDGRIEKRTKNSKNSVDKRSVGKALIHTKKREQAKILYEQMLVEFPNFNVTNSREFYRRLDKVCIEQGLGSVSINTRSKYLRDLTGWKSTQ